MDIFKADPALSHFRQIFDELHANIDRSEQLITNGHNSLADSANGHHHYGLHFDHTSAQWVFREWAPNATYVFLIGNFSNWQKHSDNALYSIGNGDWEIRKPADFFNHQDLYKLAIEWPGGEGQRIPSYATRVVQDAHTKIFNAQVWHPENPYQWECENFTRPSAPLFIYEAHIGMATEHERVGTYLEFKDHVLPRIIDGGYNAIQLMAIAEHPYYGSFGYQVSNYFAPSSRFGTPDELRSLVDAAHKAGICILLDIVHSHSVKNEVEGLSKFDGTGHQYFHDRGDRSCHPVWDSRLFNYDSTKVLHFLLSNIRYWIEEFHVDGFRFDGVTSMIYRDHGIGRHFGNYHEYFSHNLERAAVTYLGLACKLAHQMNNAITIAEDVSGFPGLAAPYKYGGIGFDYRLSLGVPDFWTNLIKKTPDHNWNVEDIYYNLINHRAEEKAISYAECHDQALVGDQAFIFRLIGHDMYHHMHTSQRHPAVDRGLALHRLIRFSTLTLSPHGYLNFMGNEFGHPEWIDFPRHGNNWSYHYARRRWSLRDNQELYYYRLAQFDAAIIRLTREHKIHAQHWPYRLYAHCDNQILAFRRGNLVFIFNFNPTNSYVDYGIPLPEGSYTLVFNTDDWEHGGQGRVQPNQTFFTLESAFHTSEVRLYLPTRTAIVLTPTNPIVWPE